MIGTDISWCDDTVNLWWGCQKVSPECAHCYAEGMAKRVGKNVWGESRRWFRDPKKWIGELKKIQKQADGDAKQRIVFIGSMMDIFEASNDNDQNITMLSYRKMLFDQIEKLDGIMFLLLTKRFAGPYQWLPVKWHSNPPYNLAIGFSVGTQKRMDEIDENEYVTRLAHMGYKTFLSMEPLLEPVQMKNTDMDWVIVGGESGPKFRPMNPEWAISIREHCRNNAIPFYFKQMSGLHPSHEITNFPEGLRIQLHPWR